MSIFKQLYNHSIKVDSLSLFIRDNILLIENFINKDYSNICEYKDDIEEFILLKISIIEKLEFSFSQNKAFIVLLIEITVRLNLRSSLLRLYSIFNNNNINIGSNLNASLLYLTNINTNQDYINKFDEICQLIQISINNEEDKPNKPLATFINYYSYVVYNTQPHTEFANLLKQRILGAIDKKTYHFFQNEIIIKTISSSLVNIEVAYDFFQKNIDNLLGKISSKNDFIGDENLIETETKYSKLLENTDKALQSIRQLSVSLYSNSSKTYYSLGRGVRILTEEDQLFSYMNSFGSMHFAKLNSAFEFLLDSFFNKQIEIIDWGCGQALASMSYLDFLHKSNIKQDINKITINDPSEIAIKRGALHIRKYSDVAIQTINKDLDNLVSSDFKQTSNIKLHLFSNILDIDDYNQKQLIELIENTFSGENYFICVSPYMNDLKTERLNSFQRYFKDNYTSYKQIEEETDGHGVGDSYWNCNNNYNGNMNRYCTHINNGCEKKWTRVLRIFKVDSHRKSHTHLQFIRAKA